MRSCVFHQCHPPHQQPNKEEPGRNPKKENQPSVFLDASDRSSHSNHSNSNHSNHSNNSSNKSNRNSNSNAGNMGNTQPVSGGVSCSSGLGGESSKDGALTTVASQEELQVYVLQQELLHQAKTEEEATQISHHLKHSLSTERLLGDMEYCGDEDDDDDANADLNGDENDSRHPNRNGSNTMLSQSSALSTSTGTTTTTGGSMKRRLSLRGFRKKSHRLLDKISHAVHAAGNAVGQKLHGVEHLVFPHAPQVGSSSLRGSTPTTAIAPKVRGGVLLRGCLTDDEHRQKVRDSIQLMKTLNGEEGLQAMGLEYRLVPPEDSGDAKESSSSLPDLTEESQHTQAESECVPKPPPVPIPSSSPDEDAAQSMTRLFDMESNTMLTMKNRKGFFADGDMYDQVARLCQEYAQEVMIEEGNLEWVTLCEAGNNPEPIRALVSSAFKQDEATLDTTPTLLIATGKGKVRAGVFSRQHLLMSGMECSTAIPIVREAQKRNMNVIMLDPNAHGDRMGMVTFEKSMARLFRRWESSANDDIDDAETSSPDRPPLANRDLYVLSHSQSGAQFARYLLEKSNYYVPHIRAVAFTDSTHNIQWARRNEDLRQLLESDSCVYFKCSKESTDCTLGTVETAGEFVETDHFWEHRFGRIQTRCAGTTEHSLTNWFARSQIWEHFDQFLHGQSINQ